MKTIALPQGPLAYREEGRGRPLLLLHANPGDHRDFDAIVPALARDYRVLAVDWPGYGESPAPEPARSASAMYFAQAAIDFADALGLRDAVVIGNSVGGYAAVRLALARPERVGALVLVSSGGFTVPTPVTRGFSWLLGREWISARIASRFAKRYLRVRNTHTRAILERTEAGCHLADRVAVNAALWRSFTHSRHDLRIDARALEVPTLLAWGNHDPVIRLDLDGRTAERTIPGAQMVTFDSGHMPFAEDPDAFLGELRAFLAGAAVRASAA